MDFSWSCREIIPPHSSQANATLQQASNYLFHTLKFVIFCQTAAKQVILLMSNSIYKTFEISIRDKEE
jgi:hypothetical protein